MWRVRHSPGFLIDVPLSQNNRWPVINDLASKPDKKACIAVYGIVRKTLIYRR